ncbi:hypothetical protein A2U01_0005816, partial [Trifolium medium]|nr:hypothetical protein [Trifolium medium]
MTTTPVLILLDFTKTFVLETDASSVAIGAVLSQEGHTLAFFSKKMCNRMQASSVYVREMFAITEAVKRWRQYLIGRHFQIFTDQKSLRNFLVQTIQTPEQQKWTSKLQGFNFEIFYKLGKSNLVVDALSRKHSDQEDQSLLLSISSAIPTLLTRLQQYYSSDKGVSFVSKITTDADMTQNYRYKEGLVYFKERIYIPEIPELRRAILEEYHSTPLTGHSSLQPTLARLSASFLWPGIYKHVKEFIQQCTICQQS